MCTENNRFGRGLLNGLQNTLYISSFIISFSPSLLSSLNAQLCPRCCSNALGVTTYPTAGVFPTPTPLSTSEGQWASFPPWTVDHQAALHLCYERSIFSWTRLTSSLKSWGQKERGKKAPPPSSLPARAALETPSLLAPSSPGLLTPPHIHASTSDLHGFLPDISMHNIRLSLKHSEAWGCFPSPPQPAI